MSRRKQQNPKSVKSRHQYFFRYFQIKSGIMVISGTFGNAKQGSTDEELMKCGVG